MKIDQKDWSDVVAWVAALARWNTFFTCTFRWEGTEDSARRLFTKFAKKHLCKSPCLWVIEKNPSALQQWTGWHIHAMAALDPHIRRKELWKEWFEPYGRNRIVPILCQESKNVNTVAGYCTKYLFKGDSYYQFDHCVDQWHVEEFALVKEHWFGV
jgi:hypothetical protein